MSPPPRQNPICRRNRSISGYLRPPPATVVGTHIAIKIPVATLRGTFLSRASLHLENLALRQQVAILKRERRRPWLQTLDRWFWVIPSRLWPRWREALVIEKPETVIGWHRKGFRAFWTWKSKHGKPGRPPVPKDVRELIRRMGRENPLWGAPRIHDELMKLGIKASEATCIEVHGAASETTVADVAKVPRQPRRLLRLDRFRYGVNGHVRGSVRCHRASPQTATITPANSDR